MSQVKRGDIILCYDRWSLISFLIRKVQHCKWSHVAWVVSDTEAIEALSNGVVRSPLSKFKNKGGREYLFVRIKDKYITQEDLERAVVLGEKDLGHKYEWSLIFRLLFAWAAGTRHSSAISGPKKMEICSQVIAENLWKACKFVFRDDVPWENIAPCDMSPERSNRVEAVT